MMEADREDQNEPQSSYKDEQRKRESGQDSGEQPLKKARHIWEVKGKGYLRQEEQPLVKDKGKLESFVYSEGLSTTDSVDSTTGSVDSSCDTSASQVLSDLQNESLVSFHSLPFNIDGNMPDLNPLTFSPVEMVIRCLDHFIVSVRDRHTDIQRWQVKQIAQAIIDNTANKILEDLDLAPTSEANSKCVENEAVEMAIHMQGLHTETKPADDVRHMASAAETAHTVFGSNKETRVYREEPLESCSEDFENRSNILLDSALNAAISSRGLNTSFTDL